ncbi:NYN domain-containing protein [Patescibacteria group bacterium]|nr:MAG: NYN domain-containing protein [Patescibacteria group bacterium]
MSVIKHKEQRVGIFIDTQNLYHCAKNLYHARVNFGQVVKDALAGRALIRAVAYVITTESGDEKNFFEALSKVGIETKTKDLQIFAGGSKKADWDVGLAVDAIKLAPKLDTVILVSGDGDFVPLVQYLQIHEGCQVEVLSFGKSTSSKLIESADDFIDLDSNPRKYLMGGAPTRGRRGADNTRSERAEREERPLRNAGTNSNDSTTPKTE